MINAVSNPFTQSVAGKAWLVILVLAIGLVPVVSAMQQPGDCCDIATAPLADRACSLNPGGSVQALVPCCDHDPGEATNANGSSPRDPAPGGDTPCDCTCCKFHTAPSSYAPSDQAGPVISLDSVCLLSILAPLRPDSAALSVDTQPPIV